MKVAILGTRGIPNSHGGFEQFAEKFSVYMAAQGHDVYVYNSHKHPYDQKEYRGVKIIHKYDPEYLIGTAGQFVYDFNCILDSRRRNFDVILQLGYTSSSVWGWLLPSATMVLTNMDGLEWKRSKYGKSVRRFLKHAEKWAVKTSDELIADSIGIQQYLYEKYNARATYIPYGADLFQAPDASVLKGYWLKKYGYNMLVARLEPENNIEVILNAIKEAPGAGCFLVIGKHETPYGSYLKKRFDSFDHIRFLGGIYDMDLLNNLRFFSNLYFHGHSVGGTNPSLLEAMASGALIVAHDNIYNKYILKEEAFFFKTSEDIRGVLYESKRDYEGWIRSNYKKIYAHFSWQSVNRKYEKAILDALSPG